MKPVSPSEKLMFSTVKVEVQGGIGTGYFYHFNLNGRIVPAIVTNKHVVHRNTDEDVLISIHLKTGDNESTRSVKVAVTDEWLFHPSYNIDLCCNLIEPVLKKIKEDTGMEPFYYPLTQDNLATRMVCEHLSALEEVTMLGAPKGIWNTQFNLPVFRKGYTACHPYYDFEDMSTGIVDMACFPGSSGSPVLIVNEQNYKDKYGNLHTEPRVLLLGTMFKTVQDRTSNDYLDLGYYVKADELLVLQKQIEKYLAKSIH